MRIISVHEQNVSSIGIEPLTLLSKPKWASSWMWVCDTHVMLTCAQQVWVWRVPRGSRNQEVGRGGQEQQDVTNSGEEGDWHGRQSLTHRQTQTHTGHCLGKTVPHLCLIWLADVINCCDVITHFQPSDLIGWCAVYPQVLLDLSHMDLAKGFTEW